jgi:hypothetical protein
VAGTADELVPSLRNCGSAVFRVDPREETANLESVTGRVWPGTLKNVRELIAGLLEGPVKLEIEIAEIAGF